MFASLQQLTAVPRPAHLQDLAALEQLHSAGVGAVLVGADAQLPLLAAPPHEDDVGCAAQLLQSSRHRCCFPFSPSYQRDGGGAAQPLLGDPSPLRIATCARSALQGRAWEALFSCCRQISKHS